MLLYILIQGLCSQPASRVVFGQKQGSARGDEGELPSKRTECEQFNSVRNLIPCRIKNNFKYNINIYIYIIFRRKHKLVSYFYDLK
jgi:hypothetical protein